MKHYNVLLFVFALSLIGCKQLSKENAGQEYKIHGTVNSMNSGTVYLMKEDGGVGNVIDSASVDNSGKFTLKGKVEESGLFTLDMNDQLVSFVIDTNEISIVAQGVPEGKSMVQGSKIQKVWDSFDHVLFDYRLRIALLKKSSLMPEEKQRKAADFYQIYSTNTKNLIKSTNNSFLTLVLASKLNVEADFPYLDSLYNVFSKELPGSVYTVDFRNNIDKVRCTIVGQPACDISLTDHKGVLTNLSDLKGKYVLLDFWASWCGPCRKENPNLVKVYKMFNTKGFEIYSVSIDESKEAWLGAISEDQLTWPQVSDLKGWEGSTAIQYGIEAIPSNFLIDKQGKIIYKNLDSKQLQMLLNKILE